MRDSRGKILVVMMMQTMMKVDIKGERERRVDKRWFGGLARQESESPPVLLPGAHLVLGGGSIVFCCESDLRVGSFRSWEGRSREKFYLSYQF